MIDCQLINECLGFSEGLFSKCSRNKALKDNYKPVKTEGKILCSAVKHG